MSNETIICKIWDHHNFNVTHICTYQYCNLQNKLLCVKCLQSGLHKHCFANSDHIIKIQLKSISVRTIKQQQLHLVQQKQSTQLNQSDSFHDKYKILKITEHYSYNQMNDIKALKISKSQKYLLLRGDSQHATIIDTQRQKLRNVLKIKNHLQECQFSFDSKLLFLTDEQCRFYSYNLNTQKIIFSIKILSQLIQSFLPINNQYVICYSISRIMILNVKKQKLIKCFDIKVKGYFILSKDALQYDKNTDMIIVLIRSWKYNKILIFNRQIGDLIIEENIQMNDPDDKIQLLLNDVLFVYCKQKIIKYQIDYSNRKIIILKQFWDKAYGKINLLQFNQQIDIIIVVDQSRLILLDSNFEIIYNYLHNYRQCQQYDYLQILNTSCSKYVVIPQQNRFIVLKMDLELKQVN